MKNYLLILLVISGFGLFGQINCDISPGNDTTLHYGESLLLFVEQNPDYTYLWSPTNETTSSIEVSPVEETIYSVTVVNTITNEECQDQVKVSVYPQIFAEFEQLRFGCAGGDCKGQIKVFATGGIPPFRYDWGNVLVDPGDSTLALGLCAGFVNLVITDAVGSTLDSNIKVGVYIAPEIKLTMIPPYSINEDDPPTENILYYQNPTAQFVYENLSIDTLPVNNWSWDFEEGVLSAEESPFHTYAAEGGFNVAFTAYYRNDCDTVFNLPLKVKPVKLFVPNVFTPNGDGFNDVFVITEDPDPESEGSPNIAAGTDHKKINDFYISNEMIIFNRWSQKIFTVSNYENDWDGENYPDGVYFYVLKCHGEYEDDVFKGAISIHR